MSRTCSRSEKESGSRVTSNAISGRRERSNYEWSGEYTKGKVSLSLFFFFFGANQIYVYVCVCVYVQIYVFFKKKKLDSLFVTEPLGSLSAATRGSECGILLFSKGSGELWFSIRSSISLASSKICYQQVINSQYISLSHVFTSVCAIAFWLAHWASPPCSLTSAP